MLIIILLARLAAAGSGEFSSFREKGNRNLRLLLEEILSEFLTRNTRWH